MFVVESTIRSATTASVGDLFLLLAASTTVASIEAGSLSSRMSDNYHAATLYSLLVGRFVCCGICVAGVWFEL